MKKQRQHRDRPQASDFNRFTKWSEQLQRLLSGRNFGDGFTVVASTLDQVDSRQAVSVIGTCGESSVAITVISADQIDAQGVLEHLLCRYFKVADPQQGD